MELDKLIDELLYIADYDVSMKNHGTVIKAVEVIKLMRELIVEENNEKWHRMIDDMEDFNNGTEET